ncbi:MAG TPA: START-like domain-containing protein [Flavobacteriales bacterium]
MSKTKIELEYILRTSDSILYNCISTPSGLEEWFAPEVHIKGDVFTFFWEGEERKAEQVSKKKLQYVKYQWLDDDDKESNYFEMRIKIHEMTGELALLVTDFADEGEEEEHQLLWNDAIEKLRRHIGG